MAPTSVYSIDYTNIGYESLREAMLARARASLPEWTDQSENDLGVLLVELFAHAADITLYYQTRIASNLFPETSDEPDAIVQLLRLIGYELRPPSPATVDLRLTFEATPAVLAVGGFIIPARSQFQATALSGDQLSFETEREVNVRPEDLDLTTSPGAARYLVPLPVVQGSTVANEVIGTADGSPNQSYRVLQQPVIAGSISVDMTEPGNLITRWQAVETLANSSPADRHFITQRDAAGAAVIQFGDAGVATPLGTNGANGLVPPSGSTIRATYRVGGGPLGNVPAKTVFRVVSLGPTVTVNDVREAINDQAAAGGGPAEDFNRARRLAPRLFRAQDRAVTLRDYQDLALQLPGVGKARAVALNWNEVVLYIAPTGQVADPSELLRRDVLAYFESRRMATTSLRVLGPAPADIYIRATVQAQPFFRRVDVQAAVERAVAEYLAFENVNFGDRVYLSKIYDVIQSLQQVTSLNVTEFSRQPNPTNPRVEADGIIELEPNELPRPGYRDNPQHRDPTLRPIIADVQGGVP